MAKEKAPQMQIEYWDIERLIPYARNPRKNDDIVLGDYTKSGCTGCDRFTCDKIKKYIETIVSELQPRYLIYESMVLSNTFKFTAELCKKYGIKAFGIIFLYSEFTKLVEAVLQRNGGVPYNVETHFSRQQSTVRSVLKLKNIGVFVKKVDAHSVKKDELYKIIDDFIAQFEAKGA